MPTVFHHGELLIQTESGIDQRIHKVGNKLIRDHIIDQHKIFFEKLSYVFIALHDADGKPWISIMQGKPGFINSPESKTLNVSGSVIAKEVLNLQVGEAMPVGIVGLDLSTRRRNRLNGNFNKAQNTELLSIAVEHSFGNCPKYIQLRNFEANKKNNQSSDSTTESHQSFDEFDKHIINIIEGADTLFIASSEKQGGNLDASHRGGLPGFIHTDGKKQLWFNDYPGNNFFQTFGNIHSYPYIGLTFIDFNSGDMLFMSGQSHLKQINVPDHNTKNKPNFLPRRCYFTLEKGLKIKNAIKGQWSAVEMSPFLNKEIIKTLEK